MLENPTYPHSRNGVPRPFVYNVSSFRVTITTPYAFRICTSIREDSRYTITCTAFLSLSFFLSPNVTELPTSHPLFHVQDFPRARILYLQPRSVSLRYESAKISQPSVPSGVWLAVGRITSLLRPSTSPPRFTEVSLAVTSLSSCFSSSSLGSPIAPPPPPILYHRYDRPTTRINYRCFPTGNPNSTRIHSLRSLCCNGVKRPSKDSSKKGKRKSGTREISEGGGGRRTRREPSVVGRRWRKERKKGRMGEGRMPMVRGNDKNGSVNVRARSPGL